MKKNKGSKNYITIVITLFFALASLALYKQSIGIKVLESINYEENASANYRVHVNDLKYYNKEYLEEGKQYISEIIDYIDVDFNNKITFDNKIDYVGKRQVVANVKIVDASNEENVIYESQEILDNEEKITNNETNEVDLSKSVKIDYKKYNSLTNEFKSNYGINAKCILTINYYSAYVGDYKDFDNVKKAREMSIKIPLSEQMITINKTTDVKVTDSYSEKTNKSIVNRTLFILSTVFLIVSIILVIYLIRNIVRNNKNISEYEKYINKLLRQYDSYITETKEVNTEGKNEIRVSSFKELLDVRNNIEKAIVYIKETEKRSKFMIIDEKEVYIYEAKEEDFI